MKRCTDLHKEYDKLANGEVHTGELPAWMHVNGKVVWYVFQGPYSELSKGWSRFMKKALAKKGSKVTGPPGDVYICSPEEHIGEEETITTILYAPLKD